MGKKMQRGWKKAKKSTLGVNFGVLWVGETYLWSGVKNMDFEPMYCIDLGKYAKENTGQCHIKEKINRRKRKLGEKM
jgi:hypothetical protein